MKRTATLCALVAALASPALADESAELARRNRTTQVAQATSRQEVERRTLEEYIRQYGHQGLNDTQIANFYIPMMQQSVYETLRGTNIREVTPENFDRLVYGDTRPKLVLFSRDVLGNGAGEQYSRGLASVFRALSIDYKDSVNFFVVHTDREAIGNIVGERMKNFMLREKIRAPPSIAMYEGGRQMDILRGGFSNSQRWQEWKKILSEWTDTRLINKNSSWYWEFNNTPNERKIYR